MNNSLLAIILWLLTFAIQRYRRCGSESKLQELVTGARVCGKQNIEHTGFNTDRGVGSIRGDYNHPGKRMTMWEKGISV